jgi:hypothetical protein
MGLLKAVIGWALFCRSIRSVQSEEGDRKKKLGHDGPWKLQVTQAKIVLRGVTILKRCGGAIYREMALTLVGQVSLSEVRGKSPGTA